MNYGSDFNVGTDCETTDIKDRSNTVTCNGFARLVKISGKAVLEGQIHISGHG